MTLLPSALPKFWGGLYRHTVPGVFHCSLLSSGFCISSSTRQAGLGCAVLLPSALLPLLECTTHTVQGPAAPQTSVMPHLLICPGPLPFLSTHGGPIGQHCLQRAGALHSWCCGVQHTPCCAPRQHCPLTGAILPSVSLPNTCLVQSESVKADQKLLPDSLKDPHKVPQYPHRLSQEINISLPHNHVHTPVPCTPQLYLLWAVQNKRADCALRPQPLPW